MAMKPKPKLLVWQLWYHQQLSLVQSKHIRADRQFAMWTQAPVKMKVTTFKWLALTATLLLCFTLVADCYDPLDPNGNITIKWDINSWTPDGYVATVTIFNSQQYRHVSAPGWTLGWQWTKKEVIWNMVGAEATAQGDCSAFRSDPIPHSCAPNPTIVDLLPGVPYNQQFSNCCRGGVLSSYAQDPQTAVSAFQITVGNAGTSNTTVALPKNLSFKTPGPGYSCGLATKVPPSQFISADHRRVTQAFMTWKVTCTYLQNLAQRAPTCCVSFSTFYNPRITPCAECACACASNFTVAGLSGTSESTNTCINPSEKYKYISGISTEDRSHSTAAFQPDILYCTRDMCPVKIHWHVKTNYKENWRAKVTITNRDFSRNFSDWTLTLQHPNFDNFTEAFSFNHKGLNPYGVYSNDTAVFWGIRYFNDMLMEAGPSGNVQSELLFAKGKDFTLSNGWAFPHRVYFNGDDCVLPELQDYPTLPNSSPRLQMSMTSLIPL